MGTTFSAGPQALGYLYQARVALYLLLQCPDEATVKVEGLDDIEVLGQQDSKLGLTQLKHHVKEAELTDSSPDLWKSIRVWAEQVSDRRFTLTDTRLYLVTTATAKAGSIASLLRAAGRDLQRAVELLLAVAKSSTNKALKPSFDAFLALTPALRESLVSSITIVDQHDNIEDYRQKIRQHIRPAVHADQVDALLERVEGWWFDRIVLHLLRRVDNQFISAFELNEKIASIAATFHEGSLPIDFLDAMPEEGYLDEHMSRLYVLQLQALNVKGRIVGKAILDFYRAFEQRARWLGDSLIYPDELTNYELRLVDEWERYFDGRQDELDGLETEEEFRSFGVRMLNWAQLQTENLKIKPKVDADFVRRGSFHMLADKPSPPIHWHPHFLDKLHNTMSTAAIPT